MKQTIHRFISEELLSGQVQLSEDAELLLSGLVDSIGIMRLVMFLEDSADIHIPPEDVTIENFVTITTINAYMRGRGSE